MTNVLIIGGSYFAGRVFVEELLKEKDTDISVFNRGRLPMNMQGVTELVGDREEITQIKKIPDKQWDIVVDFCAYSAKHIQYLIQNVPGNIQHYIFISTTTVYKNTSDSPIKEEAPKLEQDQHELGLYADYGYKKWLAECALRKVCEQRGIHYTILRPAIIYGPYNYAPRETYFFELLKDKKPIVIPENESSLFNFIYVVDMARIIIKCMGDKRVYDQAFNLASDELVSYKRIVEVLSKITGKDLEPVKIPIAEINQQQIPLPFPLDEQMVYSGEKIRQLFGFVFTPFLNGMHETLKYYLMAQKIREKKE